MPVFNGERFLAQAIDSILGQSFSDFEFLIVDDGSQDRSADIVREYERRDGRIRFLALERNLGVADARNRALEIATGQFIAVMDSDDVALPRRLGAQVAHLRNNPDIGVLGAGAQAVDENMAPLFDFDLPRPHALIAFNLFVASFLIHPATMMRRELLEAVGGYEPARRTAIDPELWSRLMWRTRFANLPERLLLYRRHGGQNHLTRDAAAKAQARLVRERLLERLWGEAPRATLNRFERMRRDEKLGPLERRAAARDLTRLLAAMIAAGIIDPADRRLVDSHIQRRLEGTMPRPWQMFLHWRRHHFGPG